MSSLRWIPVDSLSVWPLKERARQLGRSLKSAVHPTKSANYEGHDIPKINQAGCRLIIIRVIIQGIGVKKQQETASQKAITSI